MGFCRQRWRFLLHSVCLLLVILARPNASNIGELELGTLDVLHHFSRCLRILVMACKAYVCTAKRKLQMSFVAAWKRCGPMKSDFIQWLKQASCGTNGEVV